MKIVLLCVQNRSAYVVWERVLKDYALRETAAGR